MFWFRLTVMILAIFMLFNHTSWKSHVVDAIGLELNMLTFSVTTKTLSCIIPNHFSIVSQIYRWGDGKFMGVPYWVRLIFCFYSFLDRPSPWSASLIFLETRFTCTISFTVLLDVKFKHKEIGRRFSLHSHAVHGVYLSANQFNMMWFRCPHSALPLIILSVDALLQSRNPLYYVFPL